MVTQEGLTGRVLKHAFISSSAHDSALVDELVAVLVKNNIPVWIDNSGPQPRTPDLQESIRTAIAIQEAFVVIFAASPKARRSIYVRAELAVATRNECSILPVCIDGEDWMDCAPIELVNSKDEDCRQQESSAGTDQLVKLVKAQMELKLPPTFSSD